MTVLGSKDQPTTAGPLTASTPVRGDACLYLVLQSDQPQAPSMRFWLKGLKAFRIGAARSARFERQGELGRLRVSDPWVSTSHALVETVMGRWVLKDLGSRNGTFVNGSRAKHTILQDGDTLQLGHTFFLYRQDIALGVEPPAQEQSDQLDPPWPRLVTWVPSLAQQFANLPQVASSLVPVLVEGETGTGKELVARATHDLSGRRGPFVAVNCGAIPVGLVESTLFGHRRGAFSGAIADSVGLIRSSEGGTLFLDEIGDLPIPAQASLLRALEEKFVTAVGDSRGVEVDFRLCAATHRPLERMVEKGELRQDLYARLRGFVLRLPPLRQRLEDLGLLIQALLQKSVPGDRRRPLFHWKAARALFHHSWPMNIRELEKMIETGVTLAGEGPIRLEHLPELVRSRPTSRVKSGGSSDSPPPQNPQENEEKIRDQLISMLNEHRGNLSAIARGWGKQRMQIHRWLRKFNLKASDYRP